MKERTANLIPSLTATLLTNDIEVKDALLVSKDIRPVGSLFYIDYKDSKLDKWNDAVGTTNTLHDSGTVTVDGVTLVGGDYLSYGLNTYTDTGKYSIDLGINATYSASPTVDTVLFSMNADIDPSPLVTPRKDIITLVHKANGVLMLSVLDTAGNLIGSFETDFNPIAGELYRFLVTVDSTVAVNSKMITIFLNGIEVFAQTPSTGLRLNASTVVQPDIITIGSKLLGAFESNFIADIIAIFNSILRTESHILNLTYPETIYSTEEQVAVINTGMFSTERVLDVLNFIASNDARFTFMVRDGNGNVWYEKYYDTVTERWQTASGNISTSNIDTDLTSINLYHLFYKPADIKIKIYMQSVDGYTQSVFELLSISYDWYLTEIPGIHYTMVYGLISGTHQKKTDFRVTAELNGRTVYAGKIEMYPEKKEAVTDERMYWEILLPDTDSMTVGSFYNIVINPESSPRAVSVKVPKVELIDFETLVTEYSEIGAVL